MHRPKLGRRRRGGIAPESLNNLGGLGWPDFGSLGLEEGLLIAVAVAALLVILIPILFFGLELIIVGVLLAAGLIARTLLRQPWVIEARSTDPLASGRLLEWRVRGWRKSGKLIAQIASDLSAGNEPADRAVPE